MSLVVADLVAKLGIKPDKASFKVADHLLGTVKKAVLGIVAYQSVKWFGGLIQQTTDVASKFVDLSQQVGVAIEPLQELAYAAKLSGVGVDELGGGMKKFSKLAYEASKGGETQIKTMRALGVRMKDANGKLRPVDAMLEDVANKIASMPDGTEKTALAMQAFGRSGANLIPMLNGGAAGIAAMRQEAIDLGGVIDEDTARSLEEFGDETDKVKFAFEGIRNQAVKAILPELKRLTAQFLKWVKANREMIKQRLAAVFGVLVKVLKIVATAIGVVVKVLEFADKNFGFVLAVIGSLVLAMILLGKTSVISALASAAAWVAAALPLILIGALILAAILIVQDLWVMLNGGESVFGRLYDWAVDAFVGWIDKAVRELTIFFNWVEDKMGAMADSMLEFLGITSVREVRRDSAKKERELFERGDALARESAKQQKDIDAKLARYRAEELAFKLGGVFTPANPEFPNTRPLGNGATQSFGDTTVTVNVPPGTAPDAAKSMISDALFEFRERMARELAAGGE